MVNLYTVKFVQREKLYVIKTEQRKKHNLIERILVL